MWVLTCDPGIDDAVAIAVAAGLPDLGLAGVVAGAGNVPAGVAWRNAAGMVALLGLDVPVGTGSTNALGGTPLGREPSSHGRDGLAGLAGRLPAPAAAARCTAAAAAGLVRGDVIATGPLTDVARALRSGAAVRQVVWMGGSVPGIDGAGSVGREFNAGADPAAVDEVLGSGRPVRVVPIEVTTQVPFDAGDVARWRTGPAAARLCADLVDGRGGGRWPVPLHDPVAVVAAAAPHLFRWEEAALRGGPGGALAAARRGSGRPQVAVAVALDAPAVRERIVSAVGAAGAVG